MKIKEIDDGGKKIIDFLSKNNIPYLIDLNKNITKAEFRDDIHFNDKGQKFLADILFPVIVQYLKGKKENY